MKKLLRSMTAIAASAALTFTGAAYTPYLVNDIVGAVHAADDGNDDWIHAKGSRLYDMNGNEVWITGANWFGFNCSENCAHGLYARDVDDMLQTIADHGINTLRLPISSELLVSWMNGKPDAVSSVQASYNPPEDVVGEDGTITPAGKYGDINRDFVESDGKTLKNSMEIFDIIMQKCKKYGIKAFIDVHSPDANNSGHNYELWYGKAGITTDVWIKSLTWIADKYANDDTLIGYDLKNEPHGKRGYTGNTCPSDIAKWDGSTDENNWAYAAKKCADSILKVNPNALIFIEGVEQYPKTEEGNTYDTPDIWDAPADKSPWHGAWWGGNLRGVRDYPVVPESGTSQIVYSPHDYGPSVYAQTWFDKNFTTETLLEDYWYDTWAYINAEDIAPLLIGEWGGHMDGGKNQKWMELLRDYMIDHHISHTFWCINPNSGDTGGLLDPTFMNWDTAKYNLFEKSLWQTDAGKYIGLDHQTALGKNGLSLNEFYSSGAKSNLDGGKSGGGTPVVVEKTNTTKPTTTTTTSTTTSTTTVTTTAPVETVKCEHCGKEIPKSEAIYGPLGFPVCKECYDNGVYIGTTTPPPTTATTTTTVTTTTTTTEKKSGTASFVSFKEPTKKIYRIGEELDLTGGTAYAAGTMDGGEGNWDTFYQPLDSPYFVVDASEFDNTKPGTYTIYVSPSGYPDVKKTFAVSVIADDSTTTPPDQNSTITTTVTTTKEEITPTTHEMFDFKEVLTYPTKTVYEQGESLDLSGLLFTGTLQPNGGKTCNYDEKELNYDSGFKKGEITITDGSGNSVLDSEFNKLPAGEYTVKITGTAGSYYGYNLCFGVDISYDITIKGGSTDTNTSEKLIWGDANCDGGIDMADAVLIMQSLANPNKYGTSGTDSKHITSKGAEQADVDTSTKGITSNDALQIQLFLLGKIKNLDPNA